MAVSLLALCPSRGRPTAAREVMRSFDATITDQRSDLVFVVDEDDPTADRYPAGTMVVRPTGCMGGALAAALTPEILGGASVVGMIGDDVRFRTAGWDSAFLACIGERPGIAWGDDGLQHDRLVSHWWLSRPIVDEFGMAPAGLRHFYMDNYWRDVGRLAQCLYYFPDILIEHLHPDAGKASGDGTYDRALRWAEDDKLWYRRWFRLQRYHDARRLRAIVKG